MITVQLPRLSQRGKRRLIQTTAVFLLFVGFVVMTVTFLAALQSPTGEVTVSVLRFGEGPYEFWLLAVIAGFICYGLTFALEDLYDAEQ